jgi:hypothetical protein
MGRAQHVARMKKKINDDGSSVRKHEGVNYLDDIGVGPRIILKRF